MKKIIILASILVTSAISYASPSTNDELSSIIGNYYKNESLTLVKDNSSRKQEPKFSNSSKSENVRDQIIKFASDKLGSPYVWGATGPNSFDCSGFVGYVFQKAADLSLPRVSSSQATFKPKISSMNMKKGDLVFFETTGKGRISHVGIYMGNRQFIHASSGSKRVTVSSLDSDYYSKAFRWAIDPFN